MYISMSFIISWLISRLFVTTLILCCYSSSHYVQNCWYECSKYSIGYRWIHNSEHTAATCFRDSSRMNLTTRLFLKVSTRRIANPRHSRAHARATFACALAFACQSFKLAPHAKVSTWSKEACTSKSFLERWIATRALPEYWRCVIFLLYLLGLKTQQMWSRRS